MSMQRQSDLSDAALRNLRIRYEAGATIPELDVRGGRNDPFRRGHLVRGLRSQHGFDYPIDIMYALMDAFGVGFSDVICVDGWWPPETDAELSDENLDRFIREAIETRREVWAGLSSP